MQTKDMISAYQTLNQVAEAAGVVLFGSTTAANLPLNELLQDFGVNCTVYNRSVEGLTIEEAESYIQLHYTAHAKDDFAAFWGRRTDCWYAVG